MFVYNTLTDRCDYWLYPKFTHWYVDVAMCNIHSKIYQKYGNSLIVICVLSYICTNSCGMCQVDTGYS